MDPRNIRVAIFDCPEEISEEQRKEIEEFAEFLESVKQKETQRQDP